MKMLPALRAFLLLSLLAGGACTGEVIDEDGDGVPADADCDDRRADVYPGAIEVCDDRDNNCDGFIDEANEHTPRWYADLDQDGAGGEEGSLQRCRPPEGWIRSGGDCDDSDDAIYPGADERCDGVDNDCDGEIDEGIPAPAWFPDDDDDGYGDDSWPVLSCAALEGRVTTRGDCDDGDETVHPGADEICDDRVDNDCDPSPEACRHPADTLSRNIADRLDGNDAFSRFGDNAHVSLDVDGEVVASWVAATSAGEGATGRVQRLSGPILGVRRIEDPDVVLDGAYFDSRTGAAMAGYGDLTGDGVTDLVVSAPRRTLASRQEWRGAVYVFAGPVEADGDVTGAAVEIRGAEDGDELGTGVLDVEDFDGDGIRDLVVSAPRALVSGDRAGRVYVFRGPLEPTDPEAGNLLDLSTAYLTLSGAAVGDLAGSAVVSLGDLDGDGRTDIAVGAPRAAYAGADAGSVYIIAGGTQGSVSLATVGIRIDASWSRAELGTALAAGDLDQDGDLELLISAPATFSSSFPGRVYAVDPPLAGLHDVEDLATAVVVGEDAGSAVGATVAFVGDSDGDGFGDIALGDPRDDSATTDGGVVYLVYGPVEGEIDLRTRGRRFRGTDPAGNFGAAIHPAGDQDRDGVADFFVSAPGYSNGDVKSGSLFAIYGRGQ